MPDRKEVNVKKFNYRMQSILDIKAKLEEQEKTNYGLAKLRLNEEEEKLELLNLRKGEYEEKLKGNVTGVLHVTDIRRCSSDIEVMKHLIEQQELQVKKAEQNVNYARQKLTIAIREHKMHEILRDKAFENYILEINDEERKEIDENVGFSYWDRQKLS